MAPLTIKFIKGDCPCQINEKTSNFKPTTGSYLLAPAFPDSENVDTVYVNKNRMQSFAYKHFVKMLFTNNILTKCCWVNVVISSENSHVWQSGELHQNSVSAHWQQRWFLRYYHNYIFNIIMIIYNIITNYWKYKLLKIIKFQTNWKCDNNLVVDCI